MGWMIKCAESVKKDQSYMLYRLPASTVERLLLPLENMADKEAAREMLRLKIARKFASSMMKWATQHISLIEVSK